jgi:hypothetical protein
LLITKSGFWAISVNTPDGLKVKTLKETIVLNKIQGHPMQFIAVCGTSKMFDCREVL